MKKLLLLMLVMLNSVAAWCADGDTFTASVSVPKTSTWSISVKMTFKIISESSKTCQLGDGVNQAIDGYPDLTKLELPDLVKNYKIVRIGDYAFAQGGLCDITTVVLPSYVTSIGKRAFYLSNLESITFPNGFNTIGEEAFASSKIANIDIPSTVSDIGDKAFASCSKLTSFTIPEGVSVLKNGLFQNCIKLSNIVWHNGVTFIGNSVFQGCTLLANISVPKSVTTIGVAAFENCSSLLSVTLSSGLTDIQSAAFQSCSKLNSITLPNSVTTLGSQAFDQCTNLSTVNLSSNIQKIDQSTFKGCTSLRSITIPTKIASIGAGAFQGCSQLESITIPGNVKTIDAYAFSGCTNLGQLELSEGITTLGYNAFYGCVSLTSLTLPSTIETWESYTFDGCTGLKNIVFTNGLTSIGADAFRGCTSVNFISIPSSITTIGDYAFWNCSALANVTLYAPSLSTYNANVFINNASGRKIYVLADKVTSYRAKLSDYSSDIYPIALTANDAGTSGKWCTYYNEGANITVSSGTSIYKAKLDEVNNKVILTKVEGDIIKAGEAVVLNSTSESIELSSAASAGTGDYSDNDLKGGNSVASGKVPYTLANDDTYGMGFYKFDIANYALDPYKAHLEVASAGARTFYGFGDGDNATSIETLDAIIDQADGVVYDLMGRRMAGKQLKSGIYVKNAKKFIVK